MKGKTMAKKDCYLNHSRNMSTSYKKDNYFYDIERSRATAKQIKFYKKLRYLFKENNIDVNTELDKRKIPHKTVQDPSGRAEFSEAIALMIDILTELGIWKGKEDRRDEFQPTYNTVVDSGGAVVRAYQTIEHISNI